jgi:CDP-diacylglycerol--glycerol-3-phosphate 3-phosphatidyltransferase
MTYTRAIGVGCKWVLDKIVRSLALARINPNILTFIGLVINCIAAALFGYGKFFAAGRW